MYNGVKDIVYNGVKNIGEIMARRATGTKVSELRKLSHEERQGEKYEQILSGIEKDLIDARNANKRQASKVERLERLVEKYKTQLFGAGDEEELQKRYDLNTEDGIRIAQDDIANAAVQHATAASGDPQTSYMIQGLKAAQEVINKHHMVVRDNTVQKIYELESRVDEAATLLYSQKMDLDERDKEINRLKMEIQSAKHHNRSETCEKMTH